MITADAIIYGPTDKLLQSNKLDNKTVIQIGGSNRVNMAKASRIIQGRGYKEVNINLGCPSNRVQAGNFGACLMENPSLVVDCINNILDTCEILVNLTDKSDNHINFSNCLQHVMYFEKHENVPSAPPGLSHLQKAYMGYN